MGIDQREENTCALTEMEIDAIGEILNISMGSAATAISSMLDKQVLITTPKVSVKAVGNLDYSELEPAMIVKITYVKGITGSNIMVFRQKDMQYILNQLMGIDEPLRDDFEFDELSMSAACEVMNQMMGASATALAEFLGRSINISIPTAMIMNEENTFVSEIGLDQSHDVVAVFFDLIISDVMTSEFVCVMTCELAKMIVNQFMHVSEDADTDADTTAQAQSQSTPAPVPEAQPAAQSPQDAAPPYPPYQAQPAPTPQAYPAQPNAPQSVGPQSVGPQSVNPPQAQGYPQQTQAPAYPAQPGAMPGADPQSVYPPQYGSYANSGMPNGAGMYPPMQNPYMQPQQYPGPYPGYPQPMPPYNPYGYPAPPAYNQGKDPADTKEILKSPVNVQNVQFPNFTGQQNGFSAPLTNGNIDLLMNVPLTVSIEIGKTKMRIRDIMDFNQGSIIELEKQAGAPVDIIVNGQLMARGDVVVIDDNFAVRITEIVGTKELISSMETANK